MANNTSGHISFAPETENPGNAYAATTNARGSMYTTNPAGSYPLVTNGPNPSWAPQQPGAAMNYYNRELKSSYPNWAPKGQQPDPNLDYSKVFEQGGKRRKHRKTKKGGRKHKSRKYNRKYSRRYYR